MANINENVTKCLARMKENPDSVIDADLEIFCHDAKEDKISVMKQLVFSMGNDPDEKVQKISFKIFCILNFYFFFNPHYIASIFLYDLVRLNYPS